MQALSRLIDSLSDYLAARKGLLPAVGVICIVINLILQFFPGLGWVVQANLFLHLGVILGILGIMVAWAL